MEFINNITNAIGTTAGTLWEGAKGLIAGAGTGWQYGLAAGAATLGVSFFTGMPIGLFGAGMVAIGTSIVAGAIAGTIESANRAQANLSPPAEGGQTSEASHAADEQAAEQTQSQSASLGNLPSQRTPDQASADEERKHDRDL